MVPTRYVLLACQLIICVPIGHGSTSLPPQEIDESVRPFKITFVVKKLVVDSSGERDGNVTVQIHPDWSPRGAARIASLVRVKFFDAARFFRVVSGFMCQFGIAGKPELNAVWAQRNMKDDPVKVSNTRGRLTFATAGPGTRAAQMFINFRNNTFLDKQGFAPFGEVIEGMEFVDRVFPGYGEGEPNGNGPAQNMLEAYGNAYLERTFPGLSYIETAEFVGNFTPPLGLDYWGTGAFPNDDGLPAMLFLAIGTVGSFLFGRGVASYYFMENAKGARGQAMVLSITVGTVSFGFWLWAGINCIDKQFDFGVVLFLLSFIASFLAREAAVGLKKSMVRGFCFLMPLACTGVALNYGRGLAEQPDILTMRYYLGVGIAWWTLAALSSLALGIRLARDATMGRGSKYSKQIDDELDDAEIIGARDEL